MRRIVAFFAGVLFLYSASLIAESYPLTRDPIDVIIPCAEKDLSRLHLCIEGIRKNSSQIRRIIVISSRCLTQEAEWFDENKFPFSKQDVERYLNMSGQNAGKRSGWYFQQLLKLYAMYVIPNVSPNILCLDADTIFLNPVEFIDAEGAPLYSIGNEYHELYFTHMEQFVPGIGRVFPRRSGICHHMLMQKGVLDALFERVESYHQRELWKSFCLCVDPKEVAGCGASEYEIYFNFLFSTTQQAKIRKLHWRNTTLERLAYYKKHKYHYISCHVLQ